MPQIPSNAYSRSMDDGHILTCLFHVTSHIQICFFLEATFGPASSKIVSHLDLEFSSIPLELWCMNHTCKPNTVK